MIKAISPILITLAIVGCVNRVEDRLAKSDLTERNLRNIKQLTFDGDNGEAYFSWDGSKLIFQSNRGDYSNDKIWIMNTDGSNKYMVSPDRGAHTCGFFFPDGKRIVFASTSHIKDDLQPKPDSSKGYAWSLYPYDVFVASVDGSELRRVTSNPGYDAESITSPDGKQIVFGSQRNGDFDIYMMAADGSDVRQLTDRVGYDGGPWFSPDGKKIVWRAWYPETEQEKAKWRDCMEKNYVSAFPLDIWVMDADGSNKKRIVHNGATNWAPSWHPDGKKIIFSSNMDDWHDDIKKFGHNFELYIVNIDGAELKRITYNDVFDSFPMFSPDGKRIVFASNRNPQKPRATDIFIADWVIGE